MTEEVTTTTQEVTTAETTAPDSTGSENTSETTQTTEPQSSTTDSSDDQVVPYKRFKEVNEKAKRAEELEKRLAELEAKATPPTPEDEQSKLVKETLKNLGFVSREELERQEKQRQEDYELDKKLSQLENKYSGADGRPKFTRQEIFDFYKESGRVSSDPEVLYKIKFEKELIDWNIKQATSKTKGVESEASNGSGSANAGVQSSDLKDAAMKGDKSALRTYLKRVAGFKS